MIQGSMSAKLKSLLQSWALPWVLLFIVLNLAVTQDGEKNPMSRLAALRAISEQGSFQIDRYVDWTIDWSQAPNGHYYSNKAPGGILLAAPVFVPLDWLAKIWEKPTENGERGAPGYFQKTLLCLILQLIPFGLLVLLMDRILAQAQVPQAGRVFAVLSALFGQTASLFMNSWFGHGFTAIFFLAAALALYRRDYFYLGLAWGLALLSEYSVAITAPALLVAVLVYEKNLRWLPSLALGGFGPALLWAWYHYVCFGSPLSLATSYYNPAFNDLAGVPGTIGGTMYLLPQGQALWGLLVGANRGLLPTQPWVLFAVLMAIPPLFFGSQAFHLGGGEERRARTSVLIFAFASFAAAIIFNAMVGSWNGGYTAGPRYIAFCLPAISLVVALIWNEGGSWVGRIFWALLAVAIFFRAGIYATTILAPDEPLWPWIFTKFQQSAKGTEYLRLAIFIVPFAALAWSQWRKHAQKI